MQPVKGMDWIERLFYTDTDQLVLGFHTVRLITINISCDNLLTSSTYSAAWLYFFSYIQTDMVLYSVGQNRCIMSISCGGGHRSYGFSSLPEVNSYMYIYIVHRYNYYVYSE